jgi:hypothetical protein
MQKPKELLPPISHGNFNKTLIYSVLSSDVVDTPIWNRLPSPFPSHLGGEREEVKG